MAPEERRRELLECAERLFFERGYDSTSVEEIIGAAGVSKGAFYHYFQSKESLLEALVDRMVDAALAQMATSKEATYQDAVEELNAFLSSSRRLKVSMAPMVRRNLRVIFRPENLTLRHRINATTISKVAPHIAAILERGIGEGVFETPDPLGTAEMLLLIGTGVHDTIARAIEAYEHGSEEAAANQLNGRLQLYEIAFNRVLGLEDHTVSLVEPGFAAAVLSSEGPRD